MTSTTPVAATPPARKKTRLPLRPKPKTGHRRNGQSGERGSPLPCCRCLGGPQRLPSAGLTASTAKTQKAVIGWLSLSAAFRVAMGMAVRADIRSPHAGGSPSPRRIFRMARHARPRRHVGLPPGDSPGSLSAPWGMPKALRMEGLFCGLRPTSLTK